MKQVLALVSEAFGGYGGIAQYNRDLLARLARSGRSRPARFGLAAFSARLEAAFAGALGEAEAA